MGGTQSRYAETAQRMDEALLSLLDEKDLPFITVKEICARAQVNRSTFYLHYESINDLLEESVRYVNARFLQHFEQGEASNVSARIRTCPLEELHLVTSAYLTPYLGFIRDNRCLFTTAVRNYGALRFDRSFDRMKECVLHPILDRFDIAEADRPYLLAFYLNGLMAIVSEWVLHDCADPISHIIELMERCVYGARSERETANIPALRSVGSAAADTPR